MSELHFPWMELSILIPLIGAIVVGSIENRELAHKLAVVLCGLTLVCATSEWLDFAMLDTFEAHDHWDVIEFLFHQDVFVIDELSAPLLPLAALVYLMTVLSTLRTKLNRFSFGWTLASLAILLATLSCRGPWMLVILLALATIPPWIELRARNACTRVYTIHMGAFVGLLAVGQLMISWDSAGSALALAGGALVTTAALLRTGIIPLHCWMTDLFEKATFGTALLFVTPMTGAYALMRMVLPIAPDWCTAKHRRYFANDCCVCGGHGARAARGTSILLLFVSESFIARLGGHGAGNTDWPHRSAVCLAFGRAVTCRLRLIASLRRITDRSCFAR